MIKKLFRNLWLLNACLSFSILLYADDSSRSERIAWEREIANRVEEALEQFVGTDRAKVYLKADLNIRQTQRQSHNYNLQSQRAGGTAVSSPSPLGGQEAKHSRALVEGGDEGDVPWLWPDLGKKGNEETFVLPGLKYYGSAPGSGSGTTSGVPVQGKQTSEQTTILPQISVNKLSAIVMVDTRIPEDKMVMVNRIAQTILEVDQRRGDSLQVMRIPFVSVWKKIALSPIMVLEILKWSGGIGAIVIVGFFLYLGLHRIGMSVIQAANINTGNRQIDMNLNARAQATLGVMPVGTGGEALSSFRNGMALEGPGSQKALAHAGSGAGTHMLEVKHFTFINGTKAENIVKIIEDEDINTIALVLSHLDAERSNAVFGILPHDKQADAALIMAKTDFVDTVQIKAVEKKLKKKLESLVEGREQTVEILSHADNHTRELILTSIREKEPALAEKLQREIFKYEEIAGLTPAEIALTLEGITHEGIAVALRGMNDEFTNTVVASLPKEAQKALRQWMAIGKPQSLSKVEEVKRRIVDNARRLEHEGRISRHIKPIEREVFGETV